MECFLIVSAGAVVRREILDLGHSNDKLYSFNYYKWI